MPLKKNALGPSEAACIEEYKVVSKEDGGWLVSILASTPKVHPLPLSPPPPPKQAASLTLQLFPKTFVELSIHQGATALMLLYAGTIWNLIPSECAVGMPV